MPLPQALLPGRISVDVGVAYGVGMQVSSQSVSTHLGASPSFKRNMIGIFAHHHM